MKRLMQLSPLPLILVMYVPMFILKSLSHDQTYAPITQATLFLVSSGWLMGGQTAWLWAAGVSLAAKLTTPNDALLLYYKLFLAVPIGYVFTPLATLSSVFVPINGLFSFLTFDFYDRWHTVAVLCFIYPVLFIAKTLTTLEQKKATTFGEYTITMLTILIFPIGIFSIQPRIKRVINLSSSERYT